MGENEFHMSKGQKRVRIGIVIGLLSCLCFVVACLIVIAVLFIPQAPKMEVTNQLAQLQKSLKEQIQNVLQLHNETLQMKNEYEKKWDELNEPSDQQQEQQNNNNNNNNRLSLLDGENLSQKVVPETQSSLGSNHNNNENYYDLMNQVIPETQQGQEESAIAVTNWNRISRRLSFTDEEEEDENLLKPTNTLQKNEPIMLMNIHGPSIEQQKEQQVREIEQINSILSWLNGANILQVTMLPSQIVYKIELTNIKSEQITMSVWLDLFNRSGRRSAQGGYARQQQQQGNNNNNNNGKWIINHIQVALPNRTMQKDLNFEDILEVGKRRNDVGFIVREVSFRIECYLRNRC